jgi:hypothetical protein
LSLNKLIVSLALLLAMRMQAQVAKCPPYKGKSPLSSVTVFDGPPEQRADLMPDVSKGSGDHTYASWDVAYILAAGRNLYLVCEFGGTGDKDTTTVKVEAKVEHCAYRTHKGKPAEVTCK